MNGNDGDDDDPSHALSCWMCVCVCAVEAYFIFLFASLVFLSWLHDTRSFHCERTQRIQKPCMLHSKCEYRLALAISHLLLCVMLYIIFVLVFFSCSSLHSVFNIFSQRVSSFFHRFAFICSSRFVKRSLLCAWFATTLFHSIGTSVFYEDGDGNGGRNNSSTSTSRVHCCSCWMCGFVQQQQHGNGYESVCLLKLSLCYSLKLAFIVSIFWRVENTAHTHISEVAPWKSFFFLFLWLCSRAAISIFVVSFLPLNSKPFFSLICFSKRFRHTHTHTRFGPICSIKPNRTDSMTPIHIHHRFGETCSNFFLTSFRVNLIIELIFLGNPIGSN